LISGIPVLAGAPQTPAKAKDAESQATPLVEAFQKGPITLSAKVTRAVGTAAEATLPLFQVPVLNYHDKLELAFAGEAFDTRVTSADWTLIVVFLPKTVAPTDQGVVDFRLKRKDGRMVVPTISVPYDSIPMIFLVPDKNGRKKVLKDLNDHLESFRTLCSKISELSSERAAVDKFLEDLDTIDKNLSPVQYDNAVLGFLHNYGNQVSGDLQGFLGNAKSNLDKFQFLTQEFRKTNVLVPGATAAPAVEAQISVGTGGNRPVSAYISIFFDLAAIIHNLWPGHQFQYLPALARDVHDFTADLYYSDWIHTTGDTRGALMCCPGKWEEQAPPAFGIELPSGESLLKKQALLKVRPKEKNRAPFTFYGHDWKLLVAGAKGESLPPLPLTTIASSQTFVVAPGPLLETLRKVDTPRLKARVVGRWGFTSMITEPFDLPVACDPAWTPSPTEVAAFGIGKACTFTLPATWAGVVEQVAFRPAKSGVPLLIAKLKEGEHGAKEATFTPRSDDAGPGFLEIRTFSNESPTMTRPLTLARAQIEVTSIEARLGETNLVLRGKNLSGLQAVTIGERRFLPVSTERGTGANRSFRAEAGKPIEGELGKKLPAFLVTLDGQKVALAAVVLSAPRPRLEEVQVIPLGAKSAGLPLTAAIPIAPTGAANQIGLLAGKGYHFPSDRAFRAAIRNAEEPTEVRLIGPGKIRVMGNNQKATFTFNPSELLGGRASGRLEVQVQDDHAGASDWLPLPATFVDLPTVAAIQITPAGYRLTGPALDQIEAVAPAPGGPWEKVGITIEEGREVVNLATQLPGGQCFLRLFGWADLVLTAKFPFPPTAPTNSSQSAAPMATPKDTAPIPGVAKPEPVQVAAPAKL
jgi:hypothetical protein